MYVGKTFISIYTCIYYINAYVKYIKIYVCEICMPFTSKLSFQKPAFLKQNFIHERNKK